MVSRLEEAFSLADEVERASGHGSVRVCADLFHMNIEEDDLAAGSRAAGGRPAHRTVHRAPRARASPTCTSTTPPASSPAPATWTSPACSPPLARSATTTG